MELYRLPEGYDEILDEFEARHAEFISGGLAADEFKKLTPAFGIYEQKQKGTFMQRVRLAGGIITPSLFAGLIELSEKYAGGFMHITTRQNVQFHGVEKENIVHLQKELARMKLLTRTAGGNCVRNVLIDPLSGVSEDDVFDVTPWGIELSNRLPENPLFASLPRKFKIAVSSSDADRALAQIADLGLIAKIQDGIPGFAVYTGGGLGASSRIGYEIFGFIPAEAIFIAATAFNEVFKEHGQGVPRSRSRLRFLIERIGREEFKKLAEEKLTEFSGDSSLKITPAEVLSAGDAEDAEPYINGFVIPQRQKNRYTMKIPLFFGHISAEIGSKICAFAEKYPETEIRFTQTQNILLRNLTAEVMGEIGAIAESAGELAKMNSFLSDVKTCAGADFCRLSITRPSAVHRMIINAVAADEELGEIEGVNIGISGCPNGCGHTMISDIGLGGRIRDGREIYKVYAGGSVSKLGEEICELYVEDVPLFILKLLKEYKKSGQDNFSRFLDSGGLESLKNIV